MVGFAGGDAARGQHQIVIGGGGRERALELTRIVAENAEIGELGAEPRDQPAEQITVGIVERGARQRRTRLDDFVPGGEQSDAHAPADLELGEAERGGKRHVLHREPPACRQRHRARPHVLAGEPAVGAAFQAGRHDDAIALERGNPPA